MNLWRIEFVNIGRKKRCWAIQCLEAEIEREVIRSLSKSGALMSRGIDFEANLETGTGTVFAGFHAVGSLKLIKIPCVMMEEAAR